MAKSKAADPAPTEPSAEGAPPTSTDPESAGPDGASPLATEVQALDRELAEIDMLIAQVRTEAGRHEQKRASHAEKVTSLVARGGVPEDVAEAHTQLVTLTRRAAVMEAQVDVLEGKRKALGRFRERLAALADLGVVPDPTAAVASGSVAAGTGALPPQLSRAVLSAQEDLRREIARAMHDGPAQSLTNIVLQAQIVERLLAARPEAAAGEVRQLISMVQQTLDATKSFIFDVRPMVLDDLGLVPTLRRAARDRGRRAGVPVEFDSIGQDRRLPVDLESGLFRILDETLSAFLAGSPDRVALRLDWGDRLEAHATASRAVAATGDAESDEEPAVAGDIPPALAAMVEDRRAAKREKAEAARRAALVTLPDTAWREIQQRAATIGAEAELLAEGSELRLVTDLPALEAAPA